MTRSCLAAPSQLLVLEEAVERGRRRSTGTEGHPLCLQLITLWADCPDKQVQTLSH